MMKFMAGVRRMPIFWQLWLALLMLINGVGPLFFLNETVAILTLVGVLSGGLIGMVLCETHGFTKILGVMHGPWVVVLALQLIVLKDGMPEGNYGKWLVASAVVTFLSLVIDVIDVAAYVRGDRADLLDSTTGRN